ncbi:MAG: glycosyltransferase family 2 protein [Deltaproteobacteria bacterium]|nr:glycosyltransferase family 2 protein [Deltaproteobacteria bacterium]
MTTPKVAIVILNWNGRDDVLNCVATLPRLTYPNYVATVVDNASSDGSVAALRERFAQQRVLVMEKNLGFCGGNNRGIQDALAQGAEYVLLLNNDTELHPQLVTELVRAAETDPQIAAVGAKNLRMENRAEVWGAYGELTYGKELVRVVGQDAVDGPAFSGMRDADWVIGNGIMMSRKAIEAVGGFDEGFFGYHEDVDWCMRARKQGFRIVFNGDAVIYHKGFGAAHPGRPIPFPVLYFLGRNGIFFARKHGTLWQRARLTVLFFADLTRLLIAGVIRRERLKPYLWLLRGFVDGVTGRLPLRALKLQ